MGNRIARFSPNGSTTFPGSIIMSKAIPCCFICAQQNEKLNLRAARNKEWVFISQGFSNWKKALVRFKEHQVSECHKLVMEYQISIPNTCGNVIQMSNDAAKKTMATNRFCILKIIECLQSPPCSTSNADARRHGRRI